MSWISDSFSSFFRGAFPGFTGAVSDMAQPVDRQEKEAMKQYMEAAKRTKQDTDKYFQSLRERTIKYHSGDLPIAGLPQKTFDPNA